MPGSPAAPGFQGTCDDAPFHIVFRQENGVGTRDQVSVAALWPACGYPTNALPTSSRTAARGAEPMRIAAPSFAVDLHHLRLAGLPAHSPFTA